MSPELKQAWADYKAAHDQYVIDLDAWYTANVEGGDDEGSNPGGPPPPPKPPGS